MDAHHIFLKKIGLSVIMSSLAEVMMCRQKISGGGSSGAIHNDGERRREEEVRKRVERGYIDIV